MIAYKANLTWLAALLAVAACLVQGSGLLWAGSAAPPAGKANLVSEYSSRIRLIDKEIISLKENLAWLKIKIGQMHNLKTAVPKSMEHSAAYKKERIRVLEITRLELSNHLETIRSQYPGSGHPQFSHEEMEAAGLEVVKKQTGEFVIRARTPVCFRSGSAKVAATYTPMLKKVAGFIQSNRPWVVVDGFADTDPINSEKFPSNFELGAARAANIVHALVSFGADPARFKVATTGKYRFPQARPMSKIKGEERYVNITLIPNGG